MQTDDVMAVSSAPSPTRHSDTLLLILYAGVIGEVVLEILAWFIAPSIVGMPMRPHLLLEALGQTLLGVSLGTPLAVSLHLILGVLVMPLSFVALRNLLGWHGGIGASIAWGVFLWLVAQAILAPLAGRPIFLGFIAYSWLSLVAHVIYAVTVDIALKGLRRRFSAHRADRRNHGGLS